MNQQIPILQLQAYGYKLIRKGQLMFEYHQWKQSLTSFLEARVILEAICENRDYQYFIKKLISSIE
ncbi:hypothetical protein PORY_000413 [Pneumocystis oryctolagi]|uniref:Uncharacterized protein n=1 Tax=Pneumocystis oryctolagi TaxID=42067 RepID=A0ACB7CFU8_9ASCO|nr:hypothetical protein PORY_000413 [Pneumocystis oryctolagi]